MGRITHASRRVDENAISRRKLKEIYALPRPHTSPSSAYPWRGFPVSVVHSIQNNTALPPGYTPTCNLSVPAHEKVTAYSLLRSVHASSACFCSPSSRFHSLAESRNRRTSRLKRSLASLRVFPQALKGLWQCTILMLLQMVYCHS